MNYLRSTTLGCKDTGIKKPEFVAKTQFLYKYAVINIQESFTIMVSETVFCKCTGRILVQFINIIRTRIVFFSLLRFSFFIVLVLTDLKVYYLSGKVLSHPSLLKLRSEPGNFSLLNRYQTKMFQCLF